MKKGFRILVPALIIALGVERVGWSGDSISRAHWAPSELCP